MSYRDSGYPIPESQVVDNERYYSIPATNVCAGCVGKKDNMCDKVAAVHGCYRVIWVELKDYVAWRLK